MSRPDLPFRPSIRSLIAWLSPALAIVLLTSCVGGSSPATPTPEPVSTAVPTPTLGAGVITVGMLADRIAVAWGSVETIRQERTVPIESGTPVASPEAIPSTRYITEIDANGNRRFTFEIGGMVMGELVAMAGDLWARGIWPIPLDATGEETAGGWLPVTPEAATADPVAAQIVTGMLAPYPPMLSGLSTAERQRVVEDLGPRTIDGRTCHAYRIPSTTSTGQPFDVIVSLDERDLPCSLESIAFGETTVDTYTFNTDIVITKPE